jgi:leucyl-tRNA synthetase
MPVIPHFSTECLNSLNIKKEVEWPKYDVAVLEENFVNIVIQINGKKRGLLKAKKNILEKEILEDIKKDNTIMKYLSNSEIKRKIYVPNKLINIII